MKIFRKFLCSLSAIAMLLFAGCLTACVGGLDFSSSSSNSEENEEPVRIIAVYEQSAQVFADTPLDDLRKDLTVSVETSLETVTETDDYTLSGTLAVGESEITVTYNPVPALTATFNVSVSEPHTHVFTNYVSDNNATCEADGTKTAVCDDENCEETDTVTDVGTKLAHVFTNYVSDGNATCQEDGTKTAVCDREGCEETDTLEDEDSTVDHAFENYVSNNDATCTIDGTKTGDCKYGCGTKDTITDVGTKLDHVFINYVSNNNATCAEDGTKTGDCKYGCGTKDTIADVGTKLDHVFTNYVSDNNATCTADGTKTAVCDRDNCEEADTIADVGTKLDHVFTNYVSDGNATCQEDGTKTAVCDRDNCEEADTIADVGTKLDHVFTNYVSDGNATCMADGTKTAKCDYKNCEETDTQPDVGSKKGHVFTNYVSDGNATCEGNGTETATCDRKDCQEEHTRTEENSALGHSFTNYVSNNDATCEENGTETATCDREDCEVEDKRTEENSALGHSFTNYVSNNDATCTADGTEKAKCDRKDCQEEHTRTEENSTRGHSYTEAVTAPTCTEKGYTTYTCACGVSYVDTYVKELGHSFTNYVSNNDAELGKDGTEKAECDNGCGATDTRTDEGSAREHIYTNYVSNNDATCTQDGTKMAKCDNGCGTTKTIPDEGSKKGHSFTNYVSDGTATCTEDGTETAECDNGCGTKDTRTKANSMLGHSHTPTVTAPTCTAQGYTTHTCTCGDSYVDTYVNALGHSYTNYVSDNNATCTADGTETAECDNGCGTKDTRTKANSMLGHSHTPTVTAPTCTAQGYTTHTCTCGDSYVDTYVNALGHSYTNYKSDSNATCQEDGTKTAKCDNDCGKTNTITDVGTKLDHVFTNYVSENNATCTADGTKTAKCDYKNCEETDTQPDVGSKKGHVFTNYVSDGTATCEGNGTETATCDREDCDVEDKRTEENSALGHEFTSYSSNGDATCTQDGTKTAKCDNGCGETDTVTDEDSALGHSFKQSKCERCSATNNLSIITAPSVTSMYYGEALTLTDGVVINELGETVTSGTWSITGVSYLASGTAKEFTTNAFVTFTPNGTEYAPVSQEIDVTLLAVAQYGSTYYATVDGALETANDSNSGTVYVLLLDTDLDSGRAKIAKTIAVVTEIKSKVTLTLPYAEDALDTLVSYVNIGEGQTYRSSAYGKPEYLKNQIYIAEEHTLNNAGQINVAGELCGGTEVNYSPLYPEYANSVTAGRHAQINLGANAKLITTGTVNCYGFINEETENNGSEFIVEKGKATVVFTIVEYRGQRIYLGMIGLSADATELKEEILAAAGKSYTPHTFQSSPFNRFFIESVTAKTTVKYGAQLLGHAVLYAYKQNQQTTLNLINNSNAILALTQRGGSVTYKYDPSTRKTDLDIYGDMTFNPLKLQMTVTVSGVSVALTLTTGATGDSDGILFPIPDYYDISLNAVGGSSTVNALAQKVKLLPGAKLTIGKGVVVNASEIAVYANNELLINGREDKHYTTNVPAELIVYGTLNVQAIGGRVIAGADGACLNIENATSVISKEIATRGAEEIWKINAIIAKAEIPYFPITYSSDEDSTLTAVGDNGDALGVNAYTAKNGKWEIGVKVSLKLNDGTDLATSQSFPCGYALNASDLLIPKRANHEFKGWYTTENCASGTEFASTTLNDEITLYAKWEKLPKLYDVTFQAVGTNANDVENTKKFVSQEITADSLFAFEPADQAGTFEDDINCGRYVVGYYADQDCTVEFDFSQEITQNTTIYVKWADKIKVTVKNSKSATYSITVGGNQVKETEFYVMQGTDISVSATSDQAGLFSTKTITITASFSETNEEIDSVTKSASFYNTATATLNVTVEGDTTITITKS